MKIGAIGNAAMQPASSNSSQVVDTESKELQTQITNAQNKLQQISSNQNMSDEEKNRLRQEIQKQISDLNNRLRKHQLEVRQQQQQQAQNTQRTSQDTSQTVESEHTGDSEQTKNTRHSDDTKRAAIQEERKAHDAHKADERRRLQDTRRTQEVRKTQEAQDKRRVQEARQAQDTRPMEDISVTQDTRQADTPVDKSANENDERRTADIPATEMKAVISADNAVKHASSQCQVSTSISNKARVVEGEIRQDSRNERNTTFKETELETLDRKASTASSAQMSILSDASGEVKRVNVKDNINKIQVNNNQTKIAEKSAKVATGFSSDNTTSKGKVDAYSKGKMFSSVNFSF